MAVEQTIEMMGCGRKKRAGDGDVGDNRAVGARPAFLNYNFSLSSVKLLAHAATSRRPFWQSRWHTVGTAAGWLRARRDLDGSAARESSAITNACGNRCVGAAGQRARAVDGGRGCKSQS
jgi:hypothetical protein